ncbi:MAG: serine/threonine-protein kinase [Candidatus Accumulibacter phosphatis]|jgi:serine/threonine protein kinase|uniref:non-specific serine/threonine protein kinase n=1 Tax=Candidatus Accumulibacter phosphatis TaxID=327160 RepID=A0A080M254_9PROT|nr:serine/threonine-protein kinase [Accumulibacter sp.]KFB71229.1 MAG: Serine/threonine-protein kinase PknB [Candidatus Accumulibacter phosphatis]HRF11286.1 serine/threonine-protein kinase [Candidatus Accumulibacter phosphatis]
MTIPEHIGKYEIRRELGKGAMGTVYEGFDPVIKRSVAIKTILAEYLANVESEAAVARFKHEAQAGGRLQHPGIVGVYEYGEDEKGAFIVMEYVQGQSLRHCLRERGRFELIDVFEVMKQLLAALDYSHRQGVVHRDIKPTNVMVLSGMKIKVMDFGVARIESSSLTQVGTVIGTPTHIAPEQLLGLPSDCRADLWSAGVILYEMLTGCGPFLADTPVTVMYKVMHIEPARPSAIVSSLPPVFDALLKRALAKKPDERFQSAREFTNALLAAFVKSKPVARPPGSSADSMLPPAPVPGVVVRNDSIGSIDTSTLGASMPLPLPVGALAEIESSLIRSIGPLAKHLVRKGMEQAKSVEEFYSRLAENIPEGVERADFLKRIERLNKAMPASMPPTSTSLPEPPSAKPAAVFDPATLAAAEKRLAQYVGPLARVLIKRAMNDSGDVQELYRKLSEQIDSEPERAAFLKGLG